MYVSTEITEAALPDSFQRLFEICPTKAWLRRAEVLASQQRQNPFLAEYLDGRHSIERALVDALSYWGTWGRPPPVRGQEGMRYFELYSFVHILTNMYFRLSHRGQLRVRGYIRDGLQSQDGLSAFAHELAVAAHLWSSGFDVEFTDIEGRSQFDFLARKENIELEVDCKIASADIGRKIHQRQTLELWRRLNPVLHQWADRGGGRTLDIVIPSTLHGTPAYMNALFNLVSQAITRERSISTSEIGEVSVGSFELEDEPALHTAGATQSDVRRIAERRLGRTNPHMIVVGRPQSGAVIVTISSRKPDRVVDGIYRALKHSAEGQFGGSNPALLAVRLLDLTPAELHELASVGPTKLEAISNRLFAGPHREHLFGVAFVSPPEAPTENSNAAGTKFSSPGPAILYKRNEHPLSDDPRIVLFEPRTLR